MVSFLRVSQPKPYMQFQFPIFEPHAPPISPSLIWSSKKYLVGSANNEAPQCVIYYGLLLLPLSEVTECSPAPYDRTPSPYNAPIMWQTKFHTRITWQVKLHFRVLYIVFIAYDDKGGRQNIVNRMPASLRNERRMCDRNFVILSTGTKRVGK